jgi:hypothetical protein
MLALLFADQAFAASSLTSPEQLFCLRIASGQKQLPVPLKEEMAERPLFRRCKNAVRGVQISEEEALADTTLRRQMTALGSITSMELPTGPYTFRRDNGQALDNSSEWTYVIGWKEKWLTTVQVRSQMRSETSSYNSTALPCSRRTTPPDICPTHRLPTAA